MCAWSSGRWRNVAIVVFGLVLLIGEVGCATSTPVEEAPLAEEKKQALKKTLAGTWRHVATVKNGEREPAGTENSVIQWTFRSDGSCTFRQEIPSVGMSETRITDWHLEGRNLVLEGDSGGRTTYYRVDEWDDDQMKWFNYETSDTFVLERVEETSEGASESKGMDDKEGEEGSDRKEE